MEKTILLYGPNYAPSHQDVIASYARILEKHYSVVFCLNESYYQGDTAFYSGKTTIPLSGYSSYLVSRQEALLVFLVSPSKDNIRAAIDAKKSNAKVVYIFHEPYSSFSQYYAKWGSSIRNIVKVCGLTYFNGKPLIKRLDGVILPSRNAMELFAKNFRGRRFESKKTLCVPLLYSNRNASVSAEDKEYTISFIGNIGRIKNFDLFVDYLAHSSLQGKALIATSSAIDEASLARIRSSKMVVEIHQGKRIDGAEMESYYRKSHAVWLFYKDSTQSAVLPMCYRHGAAAISSTAKGIAQDVINGETGFVMPQYDVKEIDRFIHEIVNNENQFISKTTAYFDTHFCYSRHAENVSGFFAKCLEGTD